MQSLVFFNHFEEIQTVLFQAELIIGNAPLIYVYPNTLETCLTPNHFLFGRPKYSPKHDLQLGI